MCAAVIRGSTPSAYWRHAMLTQLPPLAPRARSGGAWREGVRQLLAEPDWHCFSNHEAPLRVRAAAPCCRAACGSSSRVCMPLCSAWRQAACHPAMQSHSEALSLSLLLLQEPQRCRALSSLEFVHDLLHRGLGGPSGHLVCTAPSRCRCPDRARHPLSCPLTKQPCPAPPNPPAHPALAVAGPCCRRTPASPPLTRCSRCCTPAWIVCWPCGSWPTRTTGSAVASPAAALSRCPGGARCADSAAALSMAGWHRVGRASEEARPKLAHGVPARLPGGPPTTLAVPACVHALVRACLPPHCPPACPLPLFLRLQVGVHTPLAPFLRAGIQPGAAPAWNAAALHTSATLRSWRRLGYTYPGLDRVACGSSAAGRLKKVGWPPGPSFGQRLSARWFIR